MSVTTNVAPVAPTAQHRNPHTEIADISDDKVFRCPELHQMLPKLMCLDPTRGFRDITLDGKHRPVREELWHKTMETVV